MGCVSDRPAALEPGEPAECRAGTAAGPSLVLIREFSFQPAEIRVRRGTAITWVNCEPPGIDAHTSTSNEAVWDSGFLARGGKFSFTFDSTGSFEYHCVPHPFMRGRVLVE